MLEAMNVGVVVQSQVYKIKSDNIAPAKVSRIADQNVRSDRQVKDDRQVKEKKNVEEEQKEKKEIQVSQDLLDELEHNINAIHNVGLQFSVHDESDQTIIKVIEKDTGNLIKQIPPEKILDLVSRMNELLGVLLDTTA